jgi:hypothetical protein
LHIINLQVAPPKARITGSDEKAFATKALRRKYAENRDWELEKTAGC